MKEKRWVHYYLLVVGSMTLTLGGILFFRTLFEHQAYPGFILGAALVIYGILRLKQRYLLRNKG